MISISALTSCASGLAASLAGGDKPLFELRPGPFVQDEFVVLELHGQEAISTLSCFEVTVASRIETVTDLAGLAKDAFGTLGKAVGIGSAGRAVGGLFGQAAGSLIADAEATALEMLILGQPATLVIHSPYAPPRIVQGICTEIERLGPLGGESSDWLGYRLTLRPRLWLGTLRRNSRIFQDVTVREIVNTILGEHRVPVRWSGGSTLPVRTYTVQHQETDYDFIKRLLAELGLFYFFEPPHGIANALLGGAVVGGVAQAAAAFGGPLGQLADVAGFTEKLVIAESSHCYLPIVSTDGSDVLGMAMGLAGAAAGIAGGASAGLSIDSGGVHLGGSVRGAIGGGASAALGALGRLASSSPMVIFQALDGLTGTDDFVFQISMERSLKPKKVTLRDFDYNHPSHELNARASADPKLVGTFEGYGSGERRMVLNTEVSATAAISTQELEIYDHHDEYQETDVNRDHARIELEQHRRDARVATGQSVCQRLVPGYRFLLEDHPLTIFNKEFAVTRVEHWGQIPEWKPAFRGSSASAETAPLQSLNYRNRFECVPAGIAFRMPRPERKLYQVTETATVVGPPGTEIHTDDQGRIKVHFHWDREKNREANSSCWLRVAQPWSGAGWGHQVIPRVGMEVVVTFLGGDLDKPLVTSCVPNAHHPMPFPLPSATRSGIRTESTPGGGGGNELSFEDAKGREQIYLRAERNLDELIRHDHSVRVGHDESVEIGHNQQLNIANDQTLRVDGTQSIFVDKDRMDRVRGSLNLQVLRDQNTEINGQERKAVSQMATHALADDLTVKIRGCYTTLIGRHDAKRSSVWHVEGVSQFSSTEATEITSEKSIHLRCGDSSILLGPNSIEFRSPTINIQGQGSGLICSNETVRMSSKKSVTVTSERLTLQSALASLGLGNSAKLDAPKVKLNCKPDPLEEDEGPEIPIKPTRIELRSSTGKPLPYERFLLTLPDGSEYSGILDRNGTAELDIQMSGGCEVLFPGLSKVPVE